VAVKKARFSADLGKHAKAGLDSSILIYHLEDIEPYSELTEAAFTAIARGSLEAVWSTITAAELLTGPFAAGKPDQIVAFERFIFSFANAVVVPPSYSIAKEAARLRGKYRLRTPDALLIATTLDQGANAFITNDMKLRKLKSEGIVVMVLDDYV